MNSIGLISSTNDYIISENSRCCYMFTIQTNTVCINHDIFNAGFCSRIILNMRIFNYKKHFLLPW